MRLYWNPRAHTGVGVAWALPARREFAYSPLVVEPPAIPGLPPSAVKERRTERTGWTLSIAQGADLSTSGRWRPWLGGELVVEQIAEGYDQRVVVYSDPVHESFHESRREELAAAGAFVAGLKVFLTERAFLAGDLSLRKYFTDTSLARSTVGWRVGVGVDVGRNPPSTERRTASPEVPDQRLRGSGYVHGGLALPWRPGVTGEQSQTYVAEPGGWTTGWVAGGGAFLYDFMSLEGELSMTGTMNAVEPSRYFMTFIEERRDLFIVANVRFHKRLFGAVTLEPLAGFAVVRREAWSQVDRMRYRGPGEWVLERGIRNQQELPPGVGIAAGADLRIGGRHVAILPSFRVFRMTVSDEFANHYPGGATGWTIRPAILLRVDFPVS